IVFDLDTQAFAAPAGDVDGGELAALDLVQHGLPGDAEDFGGLVQRQPPVGDVGSDLAAQGRGDADLPGSAGGELLAGEEAVPQPPVDGGLVHAEELRGLRDGGHDVILPAAAAICGRLGAVRDAIGAAQAGDPVAGPGQPGGGAPVLAGQYPRDRGVVVVAGQAADQADDVLAAGDRAAAAFGQRERDRAGRGALPGDQRVAGSCRAADGQGDLADHGADQLLALAVGGRRGVEHGADVGAGPLQPGQLLAGQAHRVPGPGGGQAGFGAVHGGQALLEPGFQGAGDQPVARLDLVVFAHRPAGL